MGRSDWRSSAAALIRHHSTDLRSLATKLNSLADREDEVASSIYREPIGNCRHELRKLERELSATELGRLVDRLSDIIDVDMRMHISNVTDPRFKSPGRRRVQD